MRRRNQSHHDQMVAAVAQHLVAKGFRDVRADIPGFPQPEKIVWTGTNRGHIPDASGHGDAYCLFEVETADSINDQHTADQWTLFATYAAQHGAEFWVVVPVGYRGAADQRLKDLGLTAKVWEV